MANRCKTCRQLRDDLARAQARLAELEATCRQQSEIQPAGTSDVSNESSVPTSTSGISHEPSLQQERDRMAAMLRNINDLCVGVDRQWRFTYLNPQAEAFYGESAQELLGKVAWEAYPALVGTTFYRTAHLAMEQGITTHFEVPSTLRPGRWLEFRTGPTFEGIVFFGTDITARKQAEQQLRILNETLEQRVAERTAEAEHRTGQLRRLAAELTRTEQRERQRLAQLLHDHLQQMLVAAKLNVGSLRRHTRSVPLRNGLERVNDMLATALEASRSLTVELSPPILRKGSMRDVLHWLAGWIKSRHGLTVHVLADHSVEPDSHEVRILLFQAVRELLFNVVKHAGVDEASVELHGQDDWLTVVVADEGIGFDSPDAAPDEPRGTGFGLLSIRERLELLGGRLEIDSAPGRGTRMTLIAPIRLAEAGTDLPAETPPPVAPAAHVPLSPDQTASARDHRIRVLLADDHQLVQDGLHRLLTAHGDIEVVGRACDGRQAVDLAVQLQPDVVIMDVDMPELDGVEATRTICSQLPQVRVIGLSMLGEPSVARAMVGAGAVRHLTKTAAPEVLIEAVRAVARNI